MIEVINLTKKFGAKLAVDNVSFKVKDGEIFGFLGPNGAGKSTTIKMITGLLSPDEGKIMVGGVDRLKDPMAAKKKISYVPDNPDIYEKMTGKFYLSFIGKSYGLASEEIEKRSMEYAKIFEIENDLSAYIESYSHGMKQKITLIGALIVDPDILILDEPMVGLDAKSSFNLKKIMRERCDRGKIVFFSTHVMEVAENLCDTIAIINKGKLITVGSLEDLKEKAKDEGSLEKIFLELTDEESN